MGHRTEIHDKVLNAKSLEDISEAYGSWAKTYDQDLLENFGYQAPARSVELLSKYLPMEEAVVLDAGCGTGLVGQLLAKARKFQIDGADYSQSMLDEAQAKGCYRTLQQVDLNQPLQIAADAYDAVICIGTFTLGHVQPEALHEMLRITKPGGRLCFTVRDEFWLKSNFGSLLNELEQAGQVELTELQTIDYILSEGSKCKLVLLTVL
ncbi:MAG: class I SAM-dependent DNA methyltransferase [bacterium]